MGSSTQITQQTGINISNTIAPQLNADINNNCTIATDTSQTLSEVSITGSSGVNISQKNQAQSFCNQQVALSYIDKMNLSDAALQAAFVKAQSAGGVVMPANTNVSQSTLTQISTNIDPSTAINIQIGCLQSTLAAQKITKVNITNSPNVVLSQVNSAYNQCIQNVASEVLAENHVTTATSQEVGAEASSQGWDPIASLGSLFSGLFGSLGSTALMASVGLTVCLCCVCIAVIVFGLFMSGTFGKPGDAAAMSQNIQARTPFVSAGTGGGDVI